MTPLKVLVTQSLYYSNRAASDQTQNHHPRLMIFNWSNQLSENVNRILKLGEQGGGAAGPRETASFLRLMVWIKKGVGEKKMERETLPSTFIHRYYWQIIVESRFLKKNK